jgi:tetratricopeptide (TPR) repeat protein
MDPPLEKGMGARKIAQAEAFRARGNHSAALAAYGDAIVAFTRNDERWENVSAKIGRAEVLRDMMRFEEALGAYSEAIAEGARLKHPAEPIARVGRAEVLREMNRFDEALAAYKEVTDRFPADTAAKVGRARTLSQMGRPKETEKLYRELIAANPKSEEFRAGLAEVLREAERPREVQVEPGGDPTAKKRERKEPSSQSAVPNERTFRFAKAAEQILRRALSLAKESNRAGLTSSCLLFAFGGLMWAGSDLTRLIQTLLDRSGRYGRAFSIFMEDSWDGQDAIDLGGFLGRVSQNVDEILRSAVGIAQRVSGGSQIDQHHLLAAFLVTPEGPSPPTAHARLEYMEVSISEFCQELRTFIRTHVASENSSEWDAILTPNAPPSTESRQSNFLAGPAGYTSEFCGVGGTGEVPDHLDVEGAARRLAELIALRETKLPLAVGLFGNWGSGKSHFMNLMDRHMKRLAAEKPEDWARRTTQSAIAPQSDPDSDGPWCRQIVPIYFNAWHYLDTNLWASLVTEIFDGLFRHVAGDADSAEQRKEKIKRLMAELQKANGAAAGAEETLELAIAAKARAEAEEQKAEKAAQRAAHRRDRLEGWMDGLLDNLEKLLPEGEMQEGWREAVRVLHLEEGRKSFATLTAYVTEVQSLQGRARAIGRAVLAPEGRTYRIAWLGAAVLGAPLVIGVGSWVLTSWNVEIRKVGMMMGEVTGLIAGVSAWCGVQLQRGRKLVGQVEELEKAARNKRAIKEQDPMLKRARAKVSKLVEKEEEARTQLKEARAKVRRIEEELRDLRPERRLFRFIEQRAQAQDYRTHLGLVSLVRRDFHELSRLFAETAAQAEPAATQLSDEDKEERQRLGASIDRIVLFVDDLDRCQPEKVVDVLQAVHLLLAYPLFAVVVGVDQRCLKQSIAKQFQGLISETKQEGNGEILATPLDYLEKIFHIPFHLPAMRQDGFEKFIEKLTEPGSAPVVMARETKQDDPSPVASAAAPPTDPLASAAFEGIPVTDLAGANKSIPLTQSHESTPVIGSVPLQLWERSALKNYHLLIRTPRGATRLLNTYRLVRAGIPAKEWDDFRGDEAKNGTFRVVMLLLASAAGHPALARGWFDQLRNANSTSEFLSLNSKEPASKEWMEFKKVYHETYAQTTPEQTKKVFTDSLDRVERFAF